MLKSWCVKAGPVHKLNVDWTQLYDFLKKIRTFQSREADQNSYLRFSIRLTGVDAGAPSVILSFCELQL